MLSRIELKRAAVACYDNAEELAQEAAILFEKNRYARASSLAVCGIQERAKAVVCFALYQNEPKYSKYAAPEAFWKFWYHHEKKGTVDSMDFYGSPAAASAELIERTVREGKGLEEVRQAGLYVNVFERPIPPPGRYIVAASSNVVMPKGVIGYTVALSLLLKLEHQLNKLRARIGMLRT